MELSMLKQQQIAQMNKKQATEFDSFAGEIDSEVIIGGRDGF